MLNSRSVKIARPMMAAILTCTIAFPPTPSRAISYSPTIVVRNTQDAGADSLRNAINLASVSGGGLIEFQIPLTDPSYQNGVFTIQLSSQLPDVPANTLIDGLTQAAFTGNTNPDGPEVVIKGSNSIQDGFVLRNANSIVDGLIIEGFTGNNQGAGVHIDGAGATMNQVVACYIGTASSGASSSASTANTHGVLVTGGAADNTIGGTTDGACNVISGNVGDGIRVVSSSGTTIQGNIIGLDASGYDTVQNGGVGVRIVSAHGNTVGGTSTAARNVITNNGLCDINLDTSNSNGILGNYIGTNASGFRDPRAYIPWGSNFGIVITQSQNNVIGGTAPGAGNRIAYHLEDGIQVLNSGATGNTMRGNAILLNGTAVGGSRLGINLVGGSEDTYGVTANDAGDADTGPNNLQNYPVLSSSQKLNTTITLQGTLDSQASSTYTLDFYTSRTIVGSGQGEIYVGSTSVMTDGNGHASFTYPIANGTDTTYTATATDVNGNTSEFSPEVSTVDITPRMTLSVLPGSFSETAGAGAAQGTVTRTNGDNGPSLVVNLTSSDPARVTVPATVNIPAGMATGNFAIGALDNTMVDGNEQVTITASAPGYSDTPMTVTITDNDTPTLALGVNPNPFSEAAGANAAQGTVTRNTSTTAPVTVGLSSNNTNKATVPATVTIPAGSASATFPVAAVDNSVVDGDANVIVTATAPGYPDAAFLLTVTDDEVPALGLTITPDSFSETAGANAATGTVTRNTSTATPLTVSLTSITPSNIPSRMVLPATVDIPAGQASTTFPIAAVDNNVLDGTVPVTITASASGFSPAAARVTVTDNEVPQLYLPTNLHLQEGTAGTMTVFINTRAFVPMTVTLSSSEPTQLTVEQNVTIPMGGNQAQFSFSAVDNTVVDGTRTVNISASAFAFAPCTVPVQIDDDDGPRLTLRSYYGAIAENAGANASTGTVIRNTAADTPLTVSLTSDNASLTVPATVTIPAGATSAQFPIGAVDDTIANGTRTVTITASAAGYTGSTVSIAVTDDEQPRLSLHVVPTVFTAGAGANAARATVTRNTPITTPLVVNLSKGNSSRITVPTSVTIPVGQNSVTFAIGAVTSRLPEGTDKITITASASGFSSATGAVTVAGSVTAQLGLSVTPNNFSEAAGANAATGTVTRNSATTTALTVSLSSSNTAKARVPTTVVIPAGRTSATFSVAAVDNTVRDGSKGVTITATATGLRSAVANVTVTDNEVGTLNLTVTPGVFSEGAGANAARCTVSRDMRGIHPLTVALSSSQPDKVTVPATVIIPAFAASTTFNVGAIDNNVAEPEQTVQIKATAAGYADSEAAVTVADNDSYSLVLTVTQNTFSEAATNHIKGTVLRNSATTAALTVPLASSDTGAVTVPTTVTIPAGAVIATFPITPHDDQMANGTRQVTLSATCNGYNPGVAVVSVLDSEGPTLGLGISPSTFSEGAGANAATATLARNSTQGRLTVALTSSNPNKAKAPSSVTFAAGQTSLTFPVTAVDNTIADGPADLTFTATAQGYTALDQAYNSAAAAVHVTDNDGRLSLAIAPYSFWERDGANAATAKVTRNTPWLDDLTVTLKSSHPDRASVPATVVIPAGAISAFFPVTAVNNTGVDGDASVTITASAPGLVDGTAPVLVRDDDQRLAVSVSATTLSEGAGARAATVTVTVPGRAIAAWYRPPQNMPYMVTLSTNDTSKLTVSAGLFLNSAYAKVTLLEGHTVASFSLNAVDNNLVDGPQPVTLTVQAPNCPPETFTVTVTDNDGASSTGGAARSRGVSLSSATASAATDSVQLRFSGALDAELASDASHYTVTVNGRAATVESAAYNASRHSVTLALPPGALHAGDQVSVRWNGLADAAGTSVSGSTSVPVNRGI